MKQKPTILITNDDGIQAAGIKHLWHYLKDWANVTVVAPHAEQSASGLSITIREPLHIHKLSWIDEEVVWAVTGTPADCVKMALNVILPAKPDLIVSGINRGTNAGRNLLYSGTVAGAIEGVLHSIPSIAFSCSDYESPDYLKVEPYLCKTVEYVLKNRLPEGTLLNVNFPEKNRGAIKGFKMARQGLGFWGESPEKREYHSQDHPYNWIGFHYKECNEPIDSDIVLLNQGYMTAVPIHINELTDHAHLKEKKSHFEDYFKTHFVL